MAGDTHAAQDGYQPHYRSRAKEFVELHDQVETSVNLLDSLETFLSTFQKDLSAVSGQISELQDRSKDIENRLKSRRKIEKPLSNLLVDLTIPPPLATIILDTPVGDPWIEAITEFEARLEALKLRGRVKAARDLAEVAEGLRIVAATKLRAHFLAMLGPIRTNVTTNLNMLQTSLWSKYRPLFAFLQRQAAPVASEVQRAYVGTVRTYFETGFRRYIRSLGYIKTRLVEKTDTIVTGAGEGGPEPDVDVERLEYARIDGPGPVLAYMADDKAHKEPPEALLRSLMLVLLDNGTAEYSFISTFFSTPAPIPASISSPPLSRSNSGLGSNGSMLLSPPQTSPTNGEFEEHRSNGSEGGWTPRPQLTSISAVLGMQSHLSESPGEKDQKEEQATLGAVWKQVFDPVLDYCQTYITTNLQPHPTIPLLTMIRLTEEVMLEVQKRGCPPLETFIFTTRLKMWPVWQRGMQDHIDALKRLAEGSGSGGALGSMFGKRTVSEAAVKSVCHRYVVMFNSCVALTSQQEETMIFSNLHRLRIELIKLITAYTDKITEPAAKATAQAALYEQLLQGLSKGPHPVSHPKAQSETAFWKEREEQTRRRIVSTTARPR
ncbi:Vps52-domain-containing protein [Phanerochaete sordida]|uniref:Vps52-domain-containing protein n=1 Tax=Phanerochaete sordida TaxID=48140 RepID=A0A9P3L7Y7_9APHY|nr:Vps52-domain-containing protein [Phanerochaete sordida]